MRACALNDELPGDEDDEGEGEEGAGDDDDERIVSVLTSVSSFVVERRSTSLDKLLDSHSSDGQISSLAIAQSVHESSRGWKLSRSWKLMLRKLSFHSGLG